MKLGKNSQGKIKAAKPEKQSIRTILFFVVLALTVAMIVWVYSLGKKAERTVSVAMMAYDVHKNQLITDTTFKEYKMLEGEFEKYAVAADNNSRRIILWDEAGMVVGGFAAYPLHADTVAMWEDFVQSRVDNSNTVLYSFPGKDLVELDIGTGELSTFSKFLAPGDRINITALYTEEETLKYIDAQGNEKEESTNVSRQETVFNGILLADILNNDGDSILDMMEMYNTLTVYEQAYYDESDDWKDQTTPAKILVALTPEEKARYFSFKAKSGAQFFMTVPQKNSQ